MSSSSCQELRKTKWRFALMLLVCFESFGNYFAYDNPAALQTQLQDKLNIGEFAFNLFYLVYSLPNIILPLFSGYLIDITGVRLANLLFTLLIATGQAIFALGVSVISYPIALSRRAILGLGGESLNVATSYLLLSWFKDLEVEMSFGMIIFIPRLGTIANDNLEPLIVDETGSLNLGLWIGLLVCIFSLICAILANLIDIKKDKNLGELQVQIVDESQKFKFRDIVNFKFPFWCLCVACSLFYVSVLCFGNIASNYFQLRFGYNSIQAGSIMSIIYIFGGALSPVFGIICGKIGRKSDLMIFSAVLVAIVHVAFILTPESYQPIYPIFYIGMLGISYSIYASIVWVSVSSLVKEKEIGTAVGTQISIQNLGLFIGPLQVGTTQENTTKDKGYYWVSVLLIITSGLCIIVSIMLYVYDIQHGGILHAKKLKVKSSLISDKAEFNESSVINEVS